MSSNFGILPENRVISLAKGLIHLNQSRLSNNVDDENLRLLQSRSIAGSFYVSTANDKTLKLIEEKHGTTYQANCQFWNQKNTTIDLAIDVSELPQRNLTNSLPCR